MTDQELVVCQTVGSGASTRQGASALALSPKTIEFHLSNAYRKLGIANRAQLANVVAKGLINSS